MVQGGWGAAHIPQAQLCCLPRSALTQEGGEGRADPPPAPGMLGGGEEQGLGRARAVQVGPAPGEGDAVVRGVDHQGAVEETGLAELLQDQPDPCGQRGRAQGGWREEVQLPQPGPGQGSHLGPCG